MKFLSIFVFALLLSAGFQSAHAGSDANAQQKQRILPVLVHVDRHGKLVEVSPSIKLRPGAERVLRATLEKIIVKPAMRNGRAVSSQFVANMAMDAAQREDGDFNVSFKYVSAVPLPQGDWYWQKEDHRRVALARRGHDDWLLQMRRLPVMQGPMRAPISRTAAGMKPLSVSPPRPVQLARSGR